MENDEERNRITIERIFFHLIEALRLCNQLDLSKLSSLEQREWNEKMKICKNALEFTKESVEKLSKLLSP
jgi:hypothetical protein